MRENEYLNHCILELVNGYGFRVVSSTNPQANYKVEISSSELWLNSVQETAWWLYAQTHGKMGR